MEAIIGSLAALLTTVAFWPQTVKVLREREMRGISLGMYAMFSAGVALWLVYGVMIGSWPIIAANVCTLGMALIILWMKWRYG